MKTTESCTVIQELFFSCKFNNYYLYNYEITSSCKKKLVDFHRLFYEIYYKSIYFKALCIFPSSSSFSPLKSQLSILEFLFILWSMVMEKPTRLINVWSKWMFYDELDLFLLHKIILTLKRWIEADLWLVAAFRINV